jgi:REP element-mobilizing transposase RayT
MNNEDLSILGSKVFHVFNRGNGRRDIFIEEENYEFFVLKMSRQLASVAHLLAYCLMPNHFHLLLIPKHDLRPGYELNGEVQDSMPTKELGEAMKRLQMGYTKSVNQFYNLAGSVFQQHAKSNHHTGSIREGLNYIHFNPSKAGLVGDPSEWAFSSYNEYSGIIPDAECFCNVELGQKLLAQ